MKKKISVLFILLCLFANMFTANPVYAEDEETVPETVSEQEYYEETDPGDEIVFTEEETDSGEEEAVLPEEEASVEEAEEATDAIVAPGSKDEAELSDEDFSFVIPDDFHFNPSDEEGRKTLKEENVAAQLGNMTEGVDYEEKELIFLAEDREYAQQVAQIYHSELVSFGDGVAVIRITDDELTVKDAVLACLDEKEILPLVEPNYLVQLEPEIHDMEMFIPEEGDGSNAIPPVWDWQDWIEALENPDPCITTPSDWNFQWQHNTIGSYAGWNSTWGSTDVLVAVIDQGINVNHEELAGRAYTYDIGLGVNYRIGHGNHVAGIIGAALDNGVGGAGIAPNVSILGIDVFGDNGAATADIIRAINVAVDCGADLINMSLGGSAYTWAENQTVQEAYMAGVVIVAAAGNNGTNIKDYPAALDHVICVAATNKNGLKASYSNYGAWVTIAAPGSDIYSVCSTADDPYNDAYGMMSGTSMATPVVTGALALYMSTVGKLNYDEAVSVLKATAAKSSSKQIGYGIISLENMFGKLVTAPDIAVYDNNGNKITSLSSPLPKGSYVEIVNVYPDDRTSMVFTVDGKNPAIKNGEITNGYSAWDYVSIDLDQFEKGKTITIKAATVNSLGVMGKIATVKVKTPAVEAQPVKIKTVKLDQSKVTLNYSRYQTNTLKLNAAQLINVNDAYVNLDDVDHIWTSSNPAVATVDESGNVYSMGPGSAKITLKMQDGSKKSAVCTVTVVQLAEELTLKGQDAMTPGTSATYSVTVLPSKTKNKKVEWSIASDVPGITISAAGKVTVPKNIDSIYFGETFEVWAKTLDGTEIYSYKEVKIVAKTKSISLEASDSRAIYKNGKLSSISLFSVDIKDEMHPLVDNETHLSAYVDNAIPCLWSSSNTKVAVVDEYGNVTAVGAGSAKITCTANDGSKLKATVSIKVTVPISSLSLDFGDYFLVGVGKSLSLKDKVMYGKVYGKPTTAKVKWSIQSVTYTKNSTTYDLTSQIVNGKYATIASNTTLKISKDITKVANPGSGSLVITLLAEATDGTGYTATEEILVRMPVTFLTFEYKNYGYVTYNSYNEENNTWVVYFGCDQYALFEVKSSNPNVFGCFIDYDSVSYDSYYGLYLYPVIFSVNPNSKKGSVSFTVKALDGSKKSASTKLSLK